MPHCIIEYAKTLESQVTPNTLINAVYQGALQTELFNPNAIKLRAIAYDHHQTGDQQEEFVHVTVRILSGRTVQQRTLLSDKVLN
jgi:5-carboxymethyl-2-hydroxymuconate isomerase